MINIFSLIIVILIIGSVAVTLGDAYGEKVGNTTMISIIAIVIGITIYNFVNNKKDD